jgi:hypothetical protein
MLSGPIVTSDSFTFLFLTICLANLLPGFLMA